MDGRRFVVHLMGRYYGPEGRAKAHGCGRAYVLIDGQPHLSGKPFTGRIESAYGAVAHYMDGRLIGSHQTIRSLHAESQELVPFPVYGLTPSWVEQLQTVELNRAQSERVRADAEGRS